MLIAKVAFAKAVIPILIMVEIAVGVRLATGKLNGDAQ